MKKKLVDGLISNKKTQWGESDRDFLMGLEEDQLKKMEVKNEEATSTEETPKTDVEAAAEAGAEDVKPTETPKEETPAQNKSKEQTAEEYIANAPAGIRDMLQSGYKTYNSEKEKLVKELVDNENCDFTEEFLNTKSLDELKGLAKLAAKKEETPSSPPPMFAPMANPAQNASKVEPLVAPTMNFGKEKE